MRRKAPSRQSDCSPQTASPRSAFFPQWHPEQPRSLSTITTHTACVYSAMWSPHNPDILATACGDGHLRLFDLRAQSSPVAGPHPVATIPVGGEVLSLDWNKYRTWNIATGSTDKSVKVWDLRAASASAAAGPPPPGGASARSQGQIAAVCTGHEYAVRKVAFSVSIADGIPVVCCSKLNCSPSPFFMLAPAPFTLTPSLRKLRYDRPDMGRGPPFGIAIICGFAPRPASGHGRSPEESP